MEPTAVAVLRSTRLRAGSVVSAPGYGAVDGPDGDRKGLAAMGGGSDRPRQPARNWRCFAVRPAPHLHHPRADPRCCSRVRRTWRVWCDHGVGAILDSPVHRAELASVRQSDHRIAARRRRPGPQGQAMESAAARPGTAGRRIVANQPDTAPTRPARSSSTPILDLSSPSADLCPAIATTARRGSYPAPKMLSARRR